MVNWDFFSNPIFWAVVAGIALFGWAIIPKAAKRIPVLGDKKTLLLIAVVAFAVTSGVFGAFGAGSLSRVPVSQITDLQVTTAFAGDHPAGATSTYTTENANIDDLLDIRYTDILVNETAGVYELDDGLLTVTRTGSLEPMSVPVTCIVPPVYADEAGDDGSRYNILEKNTIGEYECYLSDGSAATTSSPKMKTMLAFADGVAVKTLGIALEVSETGHDALNQYSYKDVIVQIGNMRYTLRIHRMD